MIMDKINSSRLGYAIGITGVVFYLGCVILMTVAGQDGTSWFFNSILHGLDVSTISQMHVPIGLSITGIILTFILGWIAGYLVGNIYNWDKASDKS